MQPMGSLHRLVALDPQTPELHDGTVSHHLPTGTVTFLFTDIEGSTHLLQALGASYRGVLERHNAIVRQALAAHDGIEIRTEGDSFFVVFRSATEAVEAAVAAQRGLSGERWPDGHQVRVRMGLHTGEGRLGGDSYVGLDVHRAARIAAAGHGGQVLLSAATRALVETVLPDGAALRDLGSHRLKDLNQSEHLAHLVIAGLLQDFPPIRSLETPSALPTELTSFVGRQREVDEATRLMATTRLLTLTGPGGTGKTRLAIRVAAGLVSSFRDGVFFVDLAPLTDPALVGPSVARSLGLSEQPDRPIVDLLKGHLEPRELLLVLDNFEHLLPASEAVADLLEAAPRLKVLVTSRSILNLYGEQEFAVPPLALPDPGAADDVNRLSQYEAVALFIARARTARPSFSVTSESARAVADICVRLDGLPLAIELAASRVRLLEPTEIVARLQRHLPVLTSGATNVPLRQRTLRATIEWSYELLPSSERALFARLAVFVGGCTLEAAETICNPGGELALDTFDGIASLVQQSLIQPRSGDGESRFVMLETIREYGRDRLEADGGQDEIGRRHVRYYRDLAEAAEPHFMGSDQVDWLDRVEREQPNVRGALRSSLEAGDAENGLRLGAALWRFWFQRGDLREGRGWLEALLALEPEAVSATRAKAYTSLGGLAYWVSDADATERAYESALRLYRMIGDRQAEAEALYNLAFVPMMRSDPDETRRRLETSIALAREIGRPDLIARSQGSLGLVARAAGDPKAGLTLLEDSLPFFREAGDRGPLVGALVNIAIAHRLLAQHQAGRVAYLEALQLSTESKSLSGIGSALLVGSAIESSAGRHLEAVRMMGAAVTLREATGASAPQSRMLLDDVEEAARKAIGGQAVEEALAEGRRMTLDEVVAYAASLPTERGEP
jgi:predicted ATPase/class 3 adenylate cyclase